MGIWTSLAITQHIGDAHFFFFKLLCQLKGTMLPKSNLGLLPLCHQPVAKSLPATATPPVIPLAPRLPSQQCSETSKNCMSLYDVLVWGWTVGGWRAGSSMVAAMWLVVGKELGEVGGRDKLVGMCEHVHASFEFLPAWFNPSPCLNDGRLLGKSASGPIISETVCTCGNPKEGWEDFPTTAIPLYFSWARRTSTISSTTGERHELQFHSSCSLPMGLWTWHTAIVIRPT